MVLVLQLRKVKEENEEEDMKRMNKWSIWSHIREVWKRRIKPRRELLHLFQLKIAMAYYT